MNFLNFSLINELFMIRVTAGIVQRGNTILIARKRPGKHMEGLWEFPGGKIREGESAEACLERELMEELGIKVRVTAHFMDSAYEYPGKQICLEVYQALYLEGGITLTDHDQVEWVQVSELSRYAFAPADQPVVKRLLGANL